MPLVKIWDGIRVELEQYRVEQIRVKISVDVGVESGESRGVEVASG